MRPVEKAKSPARRAIDICWRRCLPENRYKYLQASEILGLIRELEGFLGIGSLLNPEEEALLRTTLKQKPQLRLFKGECQSFILGLVHFPSVETFLETRFRITPERLMALVDIHEVDFPENKSRCSPYESPGLGSAWADDIRTKSTRTFSKSPDILKADRPNNWETGPSESASSSSWFSKWRRESPPEEKYAPSYRDSYQDPLRYRDDHKPRKSETGTWLSRWMSMGASWVSDSVKEVARGPSSRRENISGVRAGTDSTRTRMFTEPIKSEDSPNERKMHELKESLADVRFHAKKLEEESRMSTGKSMSESLDELQAAVREQARLIARLEREREREHRQGGRESWRGQRSSPRAPGVIAKIYVPWDYFTYAVTCFVRDLVEEVFPPGSKRTPPEFVVRVFSLLLGYFVMINFFKLVYFVAVLAMYSSDKSLPYIFSTEEPRESAPLSWLQEFPTLEYWSYQLREWTGY
ncbi:hypothetical protein JCM33374_g1957 [Metschnikowia sp. JCM 33374]|nr:hypothetical protein JCM33374_g1957 [Metschnikowia sp. JCM 33374]